MNKFTDELWGAVGIQVMRKFAVVTVAATGLTALSLGLATPAFAAGSATVPVHASSHAPHNVAGDTRRVAANSASSSVAGGIGEVLAFMVMAAISASGRDPKVLAQMARGRISGTTHVRRWPSHKLRLLGALTARRRVGQRSLPKVALRAADASSRL
jgi:hypothetical protein